MIIKPIKLLGVLDTRQHPVGPNGASVPGLLQTMEAIPRLFSDRTIAELTLARYLRDRERFMGKPDEAGTFELIPVWVVSAEPRGK